MGQYASIISLHFHHETFTDATLIVMELPDIPISQSYTSGVYIMVNDKSPKYQGDGFTSVHTINPIGCDERIFNAHMLHLLKNY